MVSRVGRLEAEARSVEEVLGTSELLSIWHCRLGWKLVAGAVEFKLVRDSDGPCSNSTNPISTTCGFLDWNGTAGAAAERIGLWMSFANGFRTADDLESASFISDDLFH